MARESVQLPPSVRLDATDAALLGQTMRFIAAHDTAMVIAELLPGLSPAAADWLGSVCRFDHVGALIFPDSIPQLRADLRAAGIDTGPPTPSVVVRQRLSRRYQIPAAELGVAILRTPISARDGSPCEIEIFALAATPEAGRVVAGERAHAHESHVGLRVQDRSVAPGALQSMLIDSGLRPDGGGYNRYIDATVLYFRNSRGARAELVADGRHR